MLEHGGRLRAAAARYNIPPAEWLDLSTGINPLGYAPPPVPAESWSRLPQEHDGLEQAAAAYYGTTDLLPIAGSQQGIKALPRLRGRSRVGVPHPAYAEHAHAWCRAGHEVANLDPSDIDDEVGELDVLVLVHPNNPTGATFTTEQLRAWHDQLAGRGGWLIVDEAFIEAGTEISLVTAAMPEGLVVLRSLGKFFGLAGARVGFVAAHSPLLDGLRELLGPWQVSGPARHVAQSALRDRAWQAATRQRLLGEGARLAQVLREAGLPPAGGCGLFQWVRTERAPDLYRRLAQRGILTRLFEQPPGLRFGLPGTEAEWARLRATLAAERAA